MAKCPECKHEMHDDRDFCDATACGDGCCTCGCVHQRSIEELVEALGRKKGRGQAIAALMLREEHRRDLARELVSLQIEVSRLEKANRKLVVERDSQGRRLARQDTALARIQETVRDNTWPKREEE